MSHICLTYHIVWRTRCSQPALSEAHERDLYAYIFGICKHKNCRLYRLNSMPDHVHMCVEVHPSIALSEFVRVVKQESSKWLKEHRREFPLFEGWAEGYAAFTYSALERPNVIAYIKGQKEHHRHRTFREEYEHWLTEMGQNPADDLLLRD